MNASLIYVVGASGSGKDSLMAYARAALAGQARVAFAHRYITRAADAGGENHVALSAAEFEARRASGLFAMDWDSHGYSYGIGIEINQWLAKGVTVVLNGSREYLHRGIQRYPQLLPVRIAVSPDTLRMRLHARGRETAAEIEARLARASEQPSSLRQGETISNDGALEAAGQALVDLIRRHSGVALCA